MHLAKGIQQGLSARRHGTQGNSKGNSKANFKGNYEGNYSIFCLMSTLLMRKRLVIDVLLTPAMPASCTGFLTVRQPSSVS